MDPVGDFKGKPVVNEILTTCENQRESISLILAGYQDEFEKKLFAYDPGLKSRFREILFEDFDEKELGKIWTEKRNNMGWEEADNVCTVVVKRLSKLSRKKGFGNAREVRQRLEDATKAAMTRLGSNFNPDVMRLEVEDVIGEDPRLSSSKLRDVLQDINEMIGWDRIKTSVGELLEVCSANYQRELVGKPPLDIALHRLFLGNPGKRIFWFSICITLWHSCSILPLKNTLCCCRSQTYRYRKNYLC